MITHKQLLTMGFELIEFPLNNQQYSFNHLCFIPKKGIYNLRRSQILIMIYQAGLKQGYIKGKNERKYARKKKPMPSFQFQHSNSPCILL